MKIGIDLLGIKLGKVGGLESYINNLLKGFSSKKYLNYQFVLFTSLDNDFNFKNFLECENFTIKKISIKSNNEIFRILYDGLFMEKQIKKNELDLMFSPIYSKAFFKKSKKWVTVIHDLQPIHFPDNFTFLKKKLLNFGWKNALKTSNVIAISDFVKKDIINNFDLKMLSEIKRIYNPIENNYETKNLEIFFKENKVKENEYYYTVSSMSEHKNLKTLLKMMNYIKQNKINNLKLIITGVGNSEKLLEMLIELNIKDRVILTGYISDEERNTLYKNCNLFLYPSSFEGFGMPPIEAMKLSKKVITSDIEILREVTENKAFYVENYYNPNKWLQKIQEISSINVSENKFEKYDIKNITDEYLNYFKEIKKNY